MIKFEHDGKRYVMIPCSYSYEISHGGVTMLLSPRYPPPDFYCLIENPSMFEQIMDGKDSFADAVRGNAQEDHHLIYEYRNPFL